MKLTITKSLIALIVLLVASCQPQGASDNSAENAPPPSRQDTLITLENEQAALSITLFGGAYLNFHLKSKPVNPLTWKLTPEQMPENNRAGAPFAGHFLCLGRWGSPTKGEIQAGVPHNGQATNSWWEKEQATAQKLVMTAKAPLDGMEIVREVKMDEKQPVFYVTEKITNTTSIGRLNNIVQHVTIGPPFLDTATLVDSNADKGFLQIFSYPDPHTLEFDWPNGYADSLRTPLNLRSSASQQSYVTTHIYNDPIGWLTATSPTSGVVLGYAWKTNQYPWANIWHQIEDGKPVAKGLEFGTTGIGRSYQELLATDTRFHQRNSFEFLDAGQTVSKSFVAFLLDVPADFKGVAKIELKNQKLYIEERTAQAPRNFEISVKHFE